MRIRLRHQSVSLTRWIQHPVYVCMPACSIVSDSLCQHPVMECYDMLGVVGKNNFSLPPLIAKTLQLCPTLCDPIDGSPPGSAVPGILQARTLEWVAISFSNA